MSLELTSIPLALFAGVLSILSPCVWPLVPIIMTSAAGKGRAGPLYLALGLSLAFALAGGILVFLLLNLGFNPDAFRGIAAVMLVAVGVTLAIPALGHKLSYYLSFLNRNNSAQNTEPSSAVGQFGVGMLLGFVWLPCVGPTLGAAIALASMGQSLFMATLVMFAFGMGTAGALIITALASEKALSNWRPGIFNNVDKVKRVLGVLLVILGLLVIFELDKALETLAVQHLPDWATSL